MKHRLLFFLALLTLAATSCRSPQPPQPPTPVDKKPILYLYPTEPTTVHVRLDFDGELTATYPHYNPDQGWLVRALPDGTLYTPHDNKAFYALYWEGIPDEHTYPASGFVVPGDQTAAFLEEKLALLGLSPREANEFIVYWLPEMEKNPFNFIHFADKEYTDHARLTISPQPQTLIRVFMEFHPLPHPTPVTPQYLHPAPPRQGFTVVEWGGAAIQPPNGAL